MDVANNVKIDSNALNVGCCNKRVPCSKHDIHLIGLVNGQLDRMESIRLHGMHTLTIDGVRFDYKIKLQEM